MTKPKVETGEKSKSRMARVLVTDAVWAAFRQAAHRRQITVTAYLGTLMEREVTRLRAVEAREESLSAQEALAALEEVKSLTEELARIAQRLEWAAKFRENHPHWAKTAIPTGSLTVSARELAGLPAKS